MARSGRNKVIAQSMSHGVPIDTWSGGKDVYSRSVQILKNRRKKRKGKTQKGDGTHFY